MSGKRDFAYLEVIKDITAVSKIDCVWRQQLVCYVLKMSDVSGRVVLDIGCKVFVVVELMTFMKEECKDKSFATLSTEKGTKNLHSAHRLAQYGGQFSVC